MGDPSYESKRAKPTSETAHLKPSEVVARKPGWMSGSTNQADTNQELLDTVHRGEQTAGFFSAWTDSLQSGLNLAIKTIDKPNLDHEDPFLHKLLELAIDAALAGSAEGLAIKAIESMAVHAIEHAVAGEIESSEMVQEGLKALLENSAKAVIGAHKHSVDPHADHSTEFLRLASSQLLDLKREFWTRWPAFAAGLDRFPPAFRDAINVAFTALPSDKLIAVAELKYLTAWLNFVARAKHGFTNANKANHAHGDQDINPKKIETFSTDGSFQRPPDLTGVLEVNLSPEGGLVFLNNVGQATRSELRHLGRTEFADLTIGALGMNMLVRVGKWGTTSQELIVGADGSILNRSEPTAFEKDMVVRARRLFVRNIRRDEHDYKHED